MADEPEEGFVIRDRRRFTSELTEDKPSVPPVAAVSTTPSVSPVVTEIPPSITEAADIAEEAEEYLEPGEDGEDQDNTIPDVYSLLFMFLGEMRNHALLRMGLVVNPITSQPEQDLEQARVAINTAGFIAEQLAPLLSPEERSSLKAMLSELQMHFVGQSRRG